MKNKVIIFAVIAVIVSGLLYGNARKNHGDTEYVTVKDTVMEDSVEKSLQTVSETEKTIYVHVCGAVCNPGVYTGNEDMRVYEYVQLAGGLTQEADDSYINMAGKVSDGEKLYIPDRIEAASLAAQADNEKQGKVNINTADVEKMMTLPGIGQSRAEAIIAYRNEQGAFESIEDIMKVAGIKEAAFAKIKDSIVVE